MLKKAKGVRWDSLPFVPEEKKRGIVHVAQHRDQEAITQRTQREVREGDIQGQIGLQKQPPPPLLRMAKRLEIGDAQPSYASFLFPLSLTCRSIAPAPTAAVSQGITI